MNGVEILTSKQVVASTSFNWIVFIIFVIVVTIFMSIVSWIDVKDIFVGAIVGLLTGVVIGGFLGIMFGKPTEYETQYKITISDEVKMNDFYEKYEIINQDGKIFTVREKQ